MDIDLSKVLPDDISAELWRRGEISHVYKTYKQQQEMIDFVDASPSKSINYIEAVRGFRKTSGMSYWLLRKLYQNPIRVLFASAIKDQVEELAEMFIDTLIEECPKKLQPQHLRSKFIYQFPNGSFLRLIGLDKDKLRNRRGLQYDIAYLDEIATIDDCYDMIMSVLYPIVERRNGIIICTTTPASSSGHDSNRIKAKCIADERYFKRDIYQSDIYNHERIEHNKKLLGEDSNAWRREFLLIDETDKTRQIVPEFNVNLHTFSDRERPASFHFYVSMDLGLIDNTHALFAYYDFEAATIVVEDEFCVNYKTTDDIAKIIQEKEALWPVVPKIRVADNDLQQLTDLSITHKLNFAPTQKYNKEAAINKVRTLFSSNRILISKKCANVIFQLQVGIWNKNRTDYERINGAGHLDGVDALIYLCRVVDYGLNPYVERPDFNRFMNPTLRDKKTGYENVFGAKFNGR